jgi:uncharacterized MAPEG superfamily protein
MACPNLLKAAVLSTMTLLSVPLEASAEMCQPPSSFANMPIFIVVALIGAAVGGKISEHVCSFASLLLACKVDVEGCYLAAKIFPL